MPIPGVDPRTVQAAWSIPEPWQLRPTDRGLNNRSYFVDTPSGAYVLRLYDAGAAIGRIRHEHALLDALRHAPLSFAVPVPAPTRTGETLALLPDGAVRRTVAEQTARLAAIRPAARSPPYRLAPRNEMCTMGRRRRHRSRTVREAGGMVPRGRVPVIERARRQYPVLVEKNVPMRTRDGVTLYADVYRPDAPGRFPVLVARNPYGKDGRVDPNGSTQFYARYGYISVVQDCRGRFTSEGDYDPIFQEVADGYDCVEWAARLPWSNGRAGATGQSYLGLTQYAIACNDPMPPSLQAMAPVSASSDYHASWIYHSGGAAMWGWMVPYAILKGRNTLERKGLPEILQKLDEYVEPGTNFGQPLRTEWYRQLPLHDWSERLKEAAPYVADHFMHADDGPYWDRANVNRHAHGVSVPMLHVSSWYDIFAEGAPSAYRSIKDRGRSAAARAGQRLIMGPWAHLLPYDVPTSRSTGDIDFGPAALIDLRATLLNWFDYWLKDIDTGIMDGPPVTVFTMGENRWQTLEDWPPPRATGVPYYFHSAGSANSLQGDGALSTVPPGDEPPDAYTYDPRDPAPTLGGNNLTLPLGVMDQRPVEQRHDVLVFTSEPLDRPVEVTGPVRVELWAASSAPDTDFTAKLVDVHPDGYAQNLLDGIIRARYRDSSRTPVLIEPGETYRYSIDLWATSNVFLPGHRIRVEVSSSNFPRFDRNPNTGRPIATETELIPADQRIYHEARYPSHVVLPIVPR